MNKYWINLLNQINYQSHFEVVDLENEISLYAVGGVKPSYVFPKNYKSFRKIQKLVFGFIIINVSKQDFLDA